MSNVNYVGPGRYQHYKGGEYMVLGLALQEDDLKRTYVIYKPLSPGSLLEGYPEEFWARELGNFNAQVPDIAWSGDATVPRFKFIGSEIV